MDKLQYGNKEVWYAVYDGIYVLGDVVVSTEEIIQYCNKPTEYIKMLDDAKVESLGGYNGACARSYDEMIKLINRCVKVGLL